MSECKPWCGTTEHGSAWYERKGLFYCRERCVRAARRAAKTRGQIVCDTPGCGRAIPEGGEGHPEICPVCLACLKLHGESRRSPDPKLTEAVALLRRWKAWTVTMPFQDAVAVAIERDADAFLAPLSSQAPADVCRSFQPYPNPHRCYVCGGTRTDHEDARPAQEAKPACPSWCFYKPGVSPEHAPGCPAATQEAKPRGTERLCYCGKPVACNHEAHPTLEACDCPRPGHGNGSHCRADRGFAYTSDDWCGCECHTLPAPAAPPQESGMDTGTSDE